MKFYKVKNISEDLENVFRRSRGFRTKTEGKQYVLAKRILGQDLKDSEIEVTEIHEESYTAFLLEKAVIPFSKCLDNLKRRFAELSFEDMSIEEIGMECNHFDIVNNIKFVLEDTDPSYFEYEALEQWLAHPDEMVSKLCDRVFDRDCSDENIALYNLINQGWED